MRTTMKKAKEIPKQTPATKSLREVLSKALAEPSTRRRKLKIALSIHGGVPSQSYDFDFQVSGKEIARCEMKCALTGRHRQNRNLRLAAGDFDLLLKKLLASKILEPPQEQPRFLPDTVVGCLEISDSVSTYRTFFAADKEQARTQGKTPSSEVNKVVEAIYRLGSKLMKVKERELKP